VLAFSIERINMIEFWQVPFDTLDPEAMNNTTLKYAKSVMQLEKGLPPNQVVPMLKEKVETMRERVRLSFTSVLKNWNEQMCKMFFYLKENHDIFGKFLSVEVYK